MVVKSVDLLGEFTPRSPGFAAMLSSTQCSLVDATAAFIGGTYVSHLSFNFHEARLKPLNYYRRTYMGNLSVGKCSRYLQRYGQPVCELHAFLLIGCCAAQTWLLGNTISDVLIASAMLYHVNTSHLLLLQKRFSELMVFGNPTAGDMQGQGWPF